MENKKIILPLVIALLVVVGVGAVLSMEDIIEIKEKDKTSSRNVFKSEVVVKQGGKKFFKKDFEDFDNLKKFKGKIADVNFNTGTRSWSVSSTIEETVKKGPTFASNYAVATWVCGQNCQRSSIVDVSSGDIIVDGIRSVYGVKYRVSSRLFVVNPPSNVPEDPKSNASTQYYKLKDGRLKFIGNNFFGKQDQACAQVVTKAKNEATGEILNFPTPCDVPGYGWKKI
ncbi:MAG: hypothetical protein ABEJ02_03245 [Candidatus Paceibacteria bacterium]